MKNSATSTSASEPAQGSGFQAWHFFVLLSMIGATVVVMVSKETHPVALLLLSAAVIASGFVGLTISRAVAGFFSSGAEPELGPRAREEMERQKAIVLRSIKELEFDKAMGKVSEADFAVIMPRLRARALTLMRDLENTPVKAQKAASKLAPEKTARPAARFCAACGTPHDPDARFCKSCGVKLETGA